MGKESIFRDYFYYYNKINFVNKTKIFMKFAILPAKPVDKICVWVRLGMKMHKKQHKLCRLWCENRIYKKFKCTISAGCEIGTPVKFPHPLGIVIGKGVMIGENCTIYQDVTLGQNNDAFPTVGDNVIIYAGAKICGDITIGNNAIIGANAVVTKDVPENAIVAGVPAKVIGYREDGRRYY